MKKFALLLAVVFMTAISANVFAQGTYINPEVGSVHSYRVAADMGSYLWTVTTTADLGGIDLLTDGTVVSADATNANVINLTWLNPDVANNRVYYVHVAVTDDGCTNNKVIAVQPVNNFTLDIVNVDDDGTTLADAAETNYSTCAPAISAISWKGIETGNEGDVTSANANSFDYSYGTLYFYYKITADGINFATTSWTPTITIAQAAGANADVTIETKLGGGIGDGSWGTGPALTMGSNSPEIAKGAGNNVIWVRITVDNKTGNETDDSANENLANNDYTITLVSAVDENSNPHTDLGNGSTVQTQLARPNTGEITTD